MFIDDVWSGGEAWINGKQRNKTPTEGLSPITQKKYPLLSRAIEQGLYHPRCKDVHSTYFEGISTPPDDKFTKEEIETIGQDYTLEQKVNTAKRNYEKYARMEEYSLDDKNREIYSLRKDQWLNKYKYYYRQSHNIAADTKQFGRYKQALKELAPETIVEFRDVKYNDTVRWKDLKRKYRILNQYKMDKGELTASEILKMDGDIIRDKRNNFSSDFKYSGNIAGVLIDNNDQYIIAHSKVNKITERGYKNYKGDSTVVTLKNERHYKYISVPQKDGRVRNDTHYDTEAKIFEYLADLYKEKPFNAIKMLSERGMCDSCIGVMEQFSKEHPDVKIIAVSNKKVEGNVWKRRLRKKNKEGK